MRNLDLIYVDNLALTKSVAFVIHSMELMMKNKLKTTTQYLSINEVVK